MEENRGGAGKELEMVNNLEKKVKGGEMVGERGAEPNGTNLFRNMIH
jgi:hypothetical protein